MRTDAPGRGSRKGQQAIDESALIIDPPDGESPAALVVFGALAGVFLLSFGPFNWQFSAWQTTWLTLVVVLAVIVLAVFTISTWIQHDGGPIGRFVVLTSAGFTALILFPAFIHGIALLREPGYQSVNVAFTSISTWRQWHWYFTQIHMLFPILLVLHYFLMSRLSLVHVSRCIAVVLLPCVIVQYYQGLVDPLFLNNWMPGSGRTGGLASDPNAYQIITFSLAPLVIALSILDRNRLWALFSGTVAVLAIAGLVFAGGRTAPGGIMLLALMMPLILAVAMRGWSITVRVVLGTVPFVLSIAGSLVLASVADSVGQFGVLGDRFAYTIDRLSQGGVHGLIFAGDARGWFWQMGWILLWRSPLAGWGGGGFIREYPNEVFRQTGEVPDWIDHVGNHYLMIPIDLGLPALLVQGMILGVSIWAASNALMHINERIVRFVLTILIAANLVFLLMIAVAPPYFPDSIYAWTLNIALLFVLARRIAGDSVPGWCAGRVVKGVAVVIGLSLVAALIGVHDVTFGNDGYRERLASESLPFRYERNCYNWEIQGDDRWQWCGRNARVKLPLPETEVNQIKLRLAAANPDLQDNPLIVRYGGESGPVHTIRLTDPTPRTVEIELNDDYIVEPADTGGGRDDRFVVLSLDVSRTWNPKEWGVSIDARDLGVRVQVIDHGEDAIR